MVLYPGVAELVDDDVINQCKGELYGFGVQDNVLGLGAAAPALLYFLEFQVLVGEAVFFWLGL